MAPCGKNKRLGSYKLDGLFLKRFWRCWKIMFPSLLSTSALLFFVLLGVALAAQMLIYNTGLIPSRFYVVLGNRDESGFKILLLQSFILILSTALGNSLVKYVSKLLYLQWRGLLVKFLHAGYFRNGNYYKLNVLQEKVDNPDQRITQDVERFCEKVQKNLPVFIVSPLTIAYYTYQCYKSTGYLGPLIIYGYFVASTVINKLIMTPIISLVVKQEKLEGDFRFKHMQLRTSSECIAFYKSGDLEERKTNLKLLSLLQTQQRLVNFNLFLYFSVGCIDYLGAVLSYLIIAIALFAGMYDSVSSVELSGQISRNSFFAMYLINCFTQLIDMSSNISDMAGYVHRIGQLIETYASLDSDSEDESKRDRECLRVKNLAAKGHDIVFQLSNLSYGPPNGCDALVKDLNLEIHLGKNILVTGSTGSGKSSLFRILCGIWKPISGEVTRFLPLTPTSVIFLPQKTFVTDGTLRQQVTYPFENPVYEDYSETGYEEGQRILEILHKVGLTTLSARVGGIDEPVDSNWEDMLSPGEMQRLSFARLFFHRPQIALLDEASSALDVASENLLYSGCEGLGITVVSVGHRTSLQKFHGFNLRLDGAGGWEFTRIKQE